MSGRFAFPRKDFPEVDNSSMSQARRGRGERAPSPYGRSSSSSFRSRSPQATRSVDPHGSMSVSATGANQDIVSGLWHEKLKNHRRGPSEERSSRLVDQFSNELSKEAPWVTNLGRHNNNDSDLLRSAKQRILTLSRQWHGAERDALGAVHAIGRDLDDTKAAIADLSGRIAEKEQTMNAVTGMTAMLREKLADMEKEAYLRGIDWQRPPPPRSLQNAARNADSEFRQNIDIDTFSVSSEPIKGRSSTPNRNLAWASSPIQRGGSQRPSSATARQPSPSPAASRGRSASPASRCASPPPTRGQSPARADATKGAAHVRPWRGGGIAIANPSNLPARSRSPAATRGRDGSQDVARRPQEPNSDVSFSESLNSPYADDHQAYFERKNTDAADAFQRIRREQVQRRQSMVQPPVEQPPQQVAQAPVVSHGAVAADSPGPYVNRWADESADDMFDRLTVPSNLAPAKEQAFVRQISGSRQYENDDLQKLADEGNNDAAQRNRNPSLDFAAPASQSNYAWARDNDADKTHVKSTAARNDTAPRTTLSIPLSALAGGDSSSVQFNPAAGGATFTRRTLQPSSSSSHLRSGSFGSQSSDDWTQIRVSSPRLQAQREASARQQRDAEQQAAHSQNQDHNNLQQNTAAGIATSQYPNGYKNVGMPENFSRHPQPQYEHHGVPLSGSTPQAHSRAHAQQTSSSPAPSPRVQQADRQNIGRPMPAAAPDTQPHSVSGNGVSSASPLAQIPSESFRVVYEKFRSIINPKGGKPSAREGGNSDVSGILAKKIVDRFAVSPGGHSFELEALEDKISSVQFFPGLNNHEMGVRNGFHASFQAQCDWLCRVASDIFECTVTNPEAKALCTSLKKSCDHDVSLDTLDGYLVWSRVLAIAVKTVPLVGSKSAGIRLVSSDPNSDQARSLSEGKRRKKIGDLTQPHRRGSMINMEKGWNTQFAKRKPNSRKSFGNVFAAAAAEDEKRAELESKILQQSFGGSGNSNGWIGGPPDGGDLSPKPSDASRKVLNSLKTYISTHKIPVKDIRLELSRLFPHGELDQINDVRTAVKVIGRNQISSADVHSLVKYLDDISQWRGDRKMRWSDLVEYLASS